jgi:hypothetical protein
MLKLRQLRMFVDTMPYWAQILFGVLLIAVSIVMVYGRINTEFGKKIFTKIPESEIRTNIIHILEYTIIPILITILYFYLMLTN